MPQIKGRIIKKHNDLVEGRYSMSIWQMRVFLKMISMIRADDQDFKEYRIDLAEFVKDFGLESNKNAYQELRDGAHELQGIFITIEEKLKDGSTELSNIPILIKVTRNDDKKSYICVSFHPDMMPYLMNLKNRFLIYEMKNILRLPSPYSVRIYELAKQYEKLKSRIISVEELKSFLGIEDKYPKYSNFKARIIEKSVQDINQHTDINLSYEELKEGRRVAKLRFFIMKKQEETKAENEQTKEDSLQQLLKGYEVADTVVKKWRKQYEDAYILERITYMQSQDKQGKSIQNYAAYLSSIIDKEVTSTSKMDMSEKLRITNAILFSRPELEKQIMAKYGQVSERKLIAILEEQFPEKFVRK